MFLKRWVVLCLCARMVVHAMLLEGLRHENKVELFFGGSGSQYQPSVNLDWSWKDQDVFGEREGVQVVMTGTTTLKINDSKKLKVEGGLGESEQIISLRRNLTVRVWVCLPKGEAKKARRGTVKARRVKQGVNGEVEVLPEEEPYWEAIAPKFPRKVVDAFRPISIPPTTILYWQLELPHEDDMEQPEKDTWLYMAPNTDRHPDMWKLMTVKMDLTTKALKLFNLPTKAKKLFRLPKLRLFSTPSEAHSLPHSGPEDTAEA